MTNPTTDKPVKARLILDVEYLPNGVDPTVLLGMLQSVVDRAATEGQLTGNTAAAVQKIAMTSVLVEDTMSANDMAWFMVARIDKGHLPSRLVPDRLVRYGLMEPHEFKATMKAQSDKAFLGDWSGDW